MSSCILRRKPGQGLTEKSLGEAASEQRSGSARGGGEGDGSHGVDTRESSDGGWHVVSRGGRRRVRSAVHVVGLRGGSVGGQCEDLSLSVPKGGVMPLPRGRAAHRLAPPSSPSLNHRRSGYEVLEIEELVGPDGVGRVGEDPGRVVAVAGVGGVAVDEGGGSSIPLAGASARLSSLPRAAPPSVPVAGQSSERARVPFVVSTELAALATVSKSARRRRRRKLVGDLAAHARFLQHAFRRTTRRWPGCWVRGGLSGRSWFRPVEVWACKGGQNLVDEAAFEAQVARSRDAILWYRHYVSLLRRLCSGRTPAALVTYCGQGGVSEGVKRAGGAAHGQDIRAMPRYARRFGPECFSQGDSADAASVRDLRRRAGAFLTLASPPCKAHSTARMRGAPSEEALISQTRDACREAGGLYVIENVVGARSDLRNNVCQLRGSMFGLHVDRPRLFEANFDLRVDRALESTGRVLRRGTCLGVRRRWRRLDPFGRPSFFDCCQGNLWAVQGDKPLRCTVCECADAMGLDEDHMDYDGMSQSIPPAYGEYVFGQAAMREVERRFGLEAITYDDYLARPERSRRLMGHWLRGAGGPSPDQGVDFTARAPHPDLKPAEGSTSPESPGIEPAGPQFIWRRGAVGGSAAAQPSGGSTLGPTSGAPASAHAVPPSYAPVFSDANVEGVAAASEQTVLAAEARELFFSWAGDFDVVAGPAEWHRPMAEVQCVESVDWHVALAGLGGRNSLLFPARGRLASTIGRVMGALRRGGGTRVTVSAAGADDEILLKKLGFRCVRRVRRGVPGYATEVRDAYLGRGYSFWAAGVGVLPEVVKVDYVATEAGMDPLDRVGAPKEPPSAKAARSYVPIPWDKERWDIGLPRELDEIMARRGVGIEPWEEVAPTEVPFYKWASQEGLLKSIAEADRALLAGAMEYVPLHRLDEVLASSTIHPWTIVDQGGGKWRLCHDYSVGTNRVVPTASFSLPSVWDVRPSVKPSSYFAKYDIRDGFWHVPIAEGSKKRLVVRHPGTGRLMWATRLPFGYLEAPRIFCALTEAVVSRLRKKAAGLGIHFYVFVDDVLVVGDSEELTREGMRLLEEEFAERGLQWAPHKKRGPCRSIEFLGLLLCNVSGQRGVTITKKRREKIEEEMARWMSRRPAEGELQADPRELASFLGKLVFVSQVVMGGRTYMQGMLAQFKGLVVDWRRGVVKPRAGVWGNLTIGDEFWRDLEWWRSHLAGRSLTPFDAATAAAEAVITGTDASDWGTGQVLWLDGGREESVLRFTNAERRRPINWRELLGIVRVCKVGGARLRGKTVLIETDNMAAKGAAVKGSSKAADMQELVRRLLRCSEQHGFEVRVTHTPGEKLDRPDQTSRGDAVEEPRFRLRREVFAQVEARFGPFVSFIGAEREFKAARTEGAAVARRSLWAHPTTSTVGSALRRIQEEIAADMGERTTAVALVPADGDPAWSKMLRHGTIVGRFESGCPCLEAASLSGWDPCDTRRPLALVLFPRAAGSMVARLSEAEGRRSRRCLPGSFVYALSKSGVGSLCQVVSDDDEGLVCEYWSLDATAAAKKLGRGSIFIRPRARERRGWECDPSEFWQVDGLVGPSMFSSRGHVERRAFDFRRADFEIGQAGGFWQAPREGWRDCDEVDSDEGADSDEGGASVDGALEGYSPFRPVAPMLSDAAADLDRLFGQQSGVNRGPEGAVQAREMVIRGGPTDGEHGQCRQLCQYGGGGTVCGGCQVAFEVGETMESRGDGFVHCRDGCRRLTDQRVEREAAATRRSAGLPPRYYGLYSDAVGLSGVYTDWDEVAGIRDVGDETAPFSSCESFGSFEEALAHVKECTVQRASGVAESNGVKGSLVKRVHLAEKLSDARLSMIDRCISGKCGRVHDEASTKCLGGCGAQLHVETCAQMGKGYAALGNFRCVKCRLKEVVGDENGWAPSGEIVRVVTRTMVLELGQGKKGTAAGYAEYCTPT